MQLHMHDRPTSVFLFRRSAEMRVCRPRGRRGPTMVLALLGTGAPPPLMFRSRQVAVGSALLFGGTTLSVPRSTARRPSPPYCGLLPGGWTE